MAKSDNSFPHGSCDGPHTQDHSNEKTGCGWINKKFHDYIKPYANLEGAVFGGRVGIYNLMFANLANADLRYAELRNTLLVGANLANADLSDASLSSTDLRSTNLSGADLSGANRSGVRANGSTICPNGIHWGTSGNDCGFVDVQPY